MNKYINDFISIAFALFLTTVCISTSNAKLVEGVVAIVNQEIITLSDIEQYKLRLTKGSLIDDVLVNPTKTKEIISDRQKVIDLMINEKILDSEVKKQDLEITMERVQKEIDNIAQKNNIDSEQLKKALAAEGVRFSDYQNFTKTRIERQSLIAKNVTSKIKISNDELLSYYIKNTPNSKGQSFEYTLAHILFDSSKTTEAPIAYTALENKENNFIELAKKYSTDTESLNNNALLGTFGSSELSKPMADAIFNLKIGEYSRPVKIGSTTRILKVVNKKQISDPMFERQKNQIRSLLSQKAFKKQFNLWLERKRKSAFIKINTTT